MVVVADPNLFTQDTGSLRAFAQGLFTQDKFLQDRFAEPRSRTAQSASAHPEPPESRCQSQFARGMGYTAFGSRAATGTYESVPQRYTYTGRSTTSDPNFMYYRWRIYAPTLGRFTARDPKGYIENWQINLYLYICNRPVEATDPLGLDPWSCPVPTDGCCILQDRDTRKYDIVEEVPLPGWWNQFWGNTTTVHYCFWEQNCTWYCQENDLIKNTRGTAKLSGSCPTSAIG
jgi:RHS repeat-associated protein